MKNKLLWSCLSAIIVISVIGWLTISSPGERKNITGLPWQIEVTPEGNLKVFDLILGQNTLRDTSTQLKRAPELALFETEQGRHLEAYFGKITLGPFLTKLIVRLKVSPELLERFYNNSPKREPTPSGSLKLDLSKEDQQSAMDLITNEISYAPVVDTESDMLLQLFGNPEIRKTIRTGQHYWAYPDRGLILFVNDEEKDLFHYFLPKNYPAIAQRLEQAIGAAPTR